MDQSRRLRFLPIPVVRDISEPPGAAEPAPPLESPAQSAVHLLERLSARHQGVSRPPPAAGILAGIGRQLSGADIKLDAIGLLMLALTQAGVITAPQPRALQAAYLRQIT